MWKTIYYLATSDVGEAFRKASNKIKLHIKPDSKPAFYTIAFALKEI